MRLPIVVGSSEKIERTGKTFSGHCPQCKRVERFYEAQKKFNVSAFFAISLWDSATDVQQCGACLACFEAGSIAPIEEAPAAPSLASRVVGVFQKSKPAEREEVAPPKSAPKPAVKALQSREADLAKKKAAEEHIDAELAALKKRMGK